MAVRGARDHFNENWLSAWSITAAVLLAEKFHLKHQWDACGSGDKILLSRPDEGVEARQRGYFKFSL